MTKAQANKRTIFLQCAAALFAAALFFLCARFDNKYNFPRHAADIGLMRLDAAQYEALPLTYLIDGWAYYDGVLFTPQDFLAGSAPDEYLYIGRYGGFDRGDAAKSPMGKATYRLVIRTGQAHGEYALELTQLYSRWRLYVNGALVQSVGYGESTPAQRMHVFATGETIELVYAVEGGAEFYGGMVYPPAFGSPSAVSRVLSLRFLLHAAACAAALLVGLFCLLLFFSRRFCGQWGLLFALCLCVCGCSAYPVLHEFGLFGSGWSAAERGCYYGIFLFAAALQGTLCGIPKVPRRAVLALGMLVCTAAVLTSLFSFERAGTLYLISTALGAYKWLMAGYLLFAAIRALKKRSAHGRALLAGGAAFALALIIDRVFPLYEPILLGWPVELAGYAFIAIAFALLWREAARIYRESAALRERQRRLDYELHAKKAHAALREEYLLRTERLLHENHNRLSVLRHYLANDGAAAAQNYLDTLLPAHMPGKAPATYTGNALFDALLHMQLKRAAEADVYVETAFAPLPQSLFIADEDLASLLMNLLDNAMEACARLEPGAEKWIDLTVAYENELLAITCRNAATESGRVQKKAPGHGHGLAIMGEIATRYGGSLSTNAGEDSFEAALLLPNKAPVMPA